MILDFDVVLDKPNKIHFSGDDVTGHVIVKLNSPLPLRCVMIKFIGEAKYKVPNELIGIGLHGHKPKKKKVKRKRHNNKIGPAPTDIEIQQTKKQELNDKKEPCKMRVNSEKYFEKVIYLFGHKYSSFRENLSDGVHKFAFTYTLPTSLPTVFIGRFSYVRYYCEAFIEKWSAPHETKRTYFNVANIADINNEPKASKRCSVAKTTNCWLLCCPRGTIVITARLKKIGVVPGQIVPLEVDVHNMSTIFVAETFISIVQAVSHCTSHGIPLHEDERIITVSKTGPVPQGDIYLWSKGLKVPPIPPTTFGHVICRIIAIKYKIKIQVELSGGNKPIIFTMPLIVGNIPLKKEFKTFLKNSDFDQDDQTKMPNIFINMPEFPTVWSKACGDIPKNEDVDSKQTTLRYPIYKHKNQHQDQNHVCVTQSNCNNEDSELSDNITVTTNVI